MSQPEAFDIRFTVPGDPAGKQRPRTVRRRSKAKGEFLATITPEKTVTYERTVADAGRKAMGFMPPLPGPIMIELRIYLGIASSWSQKRRALAMAGEILPTKKPDADNVLKAVKDALNGIAYLDDAQVVDAHLKKRFAETPRVEVIITPLAKAGIN